MEGYREVKGGRDNEGDVRFRRKFWKDSPEEGKSWLSLKVML